MKAFSRLKDFFKKHKWSYILGLFWLLTVDMIQLLIPRILGNLTNDFQNNTLTSNGVIKYSLYIILTGIAIGVGRYFWRIYIISNSRKLEYHLRRELFDHLLTLSPNYFSTHKTGDLMSHATNDINAIRMAMGFGIIMMVDSLFIIALSLFMMVRSTSLKLTIMAVINLPIIIIITRRFGNTIYNRSKNCTECLFKLNRIYSGKLCRY